MGSAFSSFKEWRNEKKELQRKRKLHSSMTTSERTEIIKMKAQMEQQIQALKQQIYLEERALIARSNNSQQMTKEVGSVQSDKSAKKHKQVSGLQYGHSDLSERQRLMLEACQFAQYGREYPLEKWTVGSLPNLSTSTRSFEKCYQRRWNCEDRTGSLGNFDF